MRATEKGWATGPSLLKKKRRHEEDDHQAAFIQWCNLNRKRLPGVDKLFAIPNGAWLAGTPAQRAIQWARLKRIGAKAGVYDLFIPVPIPPYSGLFIEMKRIKGGRESDDQKIFRTDMVSLGYRCCVCNGSSEAISAVEAYYSLR